MPNEFVMRGQTGSGLTEVLNFSGYKPGYAFRLVEFELWPSTNVGEAHYEMLATVTAAKTAVSPIDPDFKNEGLIGVAAIVFPSGVDQGGKGPMAVINDTFLITQDLILMVQDTQSGAPVNWQLRFVKEKISGPEEAAANYKQFLISDGS